MKDNDFNWDAAAFFERLTNTNKLAKDLGFMFDGVSSLSLIHISEPTRLID